MKEEKKVAEDSIKLGMERIRMIVTSWKDWTKANIIDCSMTVSTQWLKQAVEFQVLPADAEHRKKTGDNFYKMDEESIVTIRGFDVRGFKGLTVGSTYEVLSHEHAMCWPTARV